MSLPQVSLAVVGADYPNKDGGNRRSEIMFCSPGEPVELVPEPKNPVDPNAIAVFSCRGFQIGYLNADRALWIGSLIRAGRDVRAIFQQATPYGAAIRASLNGDDPVLPPARQKPDSEDNEDPVDPFPEFYPDDEPSDEFL